ncbi:MAG: DNA adenine methylase [Nostocaceae cyanobacterium]|nr:DNA adenine methylase [Nostocaceae cyanobacterium]
MAKSIKSPLRYPGGKSRVIDYLLPYIPLDIHEFREPFIGGGSVFFGVKNLFDQRIGRYWINDINFDLYLFWKYARDNITYLLNKINQFKTEYPDGRQLYQHLIDKDNLSSELDIAARFFIMNRITFSGIMDSGGYSQQAFEKRFTQSSLERLQKISTHLSQVHITCGDYEQLVLQDGDNVFLFLDPPYHKPAKSKLYGVKGDLHTNFDHERFAYTMKNCQHRWLLTYDDSLEIRRLFKFADITEFHVQYGMNNYKQKKAAKGQELLIKNYSCSLPNYHLEPQAAKQLSLQNLYDMRSPTINDGTQHQS